MHATMATNLYSSSLLFKSTLSFLGLALCETVETVEGREVPVTPVGGLDFSLAPDPLISPALSNFLINAPYFI